MHSIYIFAVFPSALLAAIIRAESGLFHHHTEKQVNTDAAAKSCKAINARSEVKNWRIALKMNLCTPGAVSYNVCKFRKDPMIKLSLSYITYYSYISP